MPDSELLFAAPHAHGAQGVLLCKEVARDGGGQAAVPARTVQVRATDRASGARIEPLHLTFDRGVDREGWSDTYGPRVGTSFPLLATLETAAGDPARIELALERGLSHALRVLDVDTLMPLANATFTTPNRPVVRTDADGWAQLSAIDWSVYTVEREGHEPEIWDPDEAVLFDWGALLLSRIE